MDRDIHRSSTRHSVMLACGFVGLVLIALVASPFNLNPWVALVLDLAGYPLGVAVVWWLYQRADCQLTRTKLHPLGQVLTRDAVARILREEIEPAMEPAMVSQRRRLLRRVWRWAYPMLLEGGRALAMCFGAWYPAPKDTKDNEK